MFPRDFIRSRAGTVKRSWTVLTRIAVNCNVVRAFCGTLVWSIDVTNQSGATRERMKAWGLLEHLGGRVRSGITIFVTLRWDYLTTIILPLSLALSRNSLVRKQSSGRRLPLLDMRYFFLQRNWREYLGDRLTPGENAMPARSQRPRSRSGSWWSI